MAAERVEDATSGRPEPMLNEALLRGTGDILALIIDDRSLPFILDAIARLAEELCPSMLCTVLLIEDGVRIRHGAAPSMPSSYVQAIDGLPIGPRAGSCGTAAFTKKPVGVRDIATDPLWDDYRELALSHGLRACWSTPVLDRHGNVLATFAMYYREPRDPTWFEERVIEAATYLTKMGIEHTRAMQNRFESEQRFRVLVETTTDSVWIATAEGMIVPDPEMTWGKLTGQTSEELMGTGWLDAVHPEDRERAFASWEEAVAKRTSYQQEYRIRKADGAYALVVDRGSAILRPDGTVREWIGAVTDITRQRRAEDRLRFLVDVGTLFEATMDSQKAMSDVASSAVLRIADYCAIVVQKHDGGVHMTLSAAHPHVALSEEEARQRIDCLVQAFAGVKEPLLIPRVFASTKSIPLLPREVEILRELDILSLLVAPIRARDHDAAIGAFILATDRWSGRLLEEGDLSLAEELSRRIVNALDRSRTFHDLQTAIQARDEFLSVASHELKTPLTPLQLQIQSIERRPQGEIPAWLMPKLRVIRSQVERFGRLVDQLLDISRIAEGKLQLEPTSFDFGDLVRDAVARLETIGDISRSGSTIHLQGEPGIIGTWDRFRLEQVLNNLLSNALKYGQGKPITIEWSAMAGNLVFKIRDLGIGIAYEDQDRIFTRFERAVSVRHYGGFGLGLFIVRQIVETMGGRVSVLSALGQGATFTVELPLEPKGPEPEPPE